MAPSTTIPILDVQNLTVAYQHAGQWLPAVREVSLKIHPGETYGLVGESGSGKSTLVLAVMRYLGTKGAVQQGVIHLEGMNMQALEEQELRQVWEQKIALVPQNPQSSLNPSLKIGEQLAEIFRLQQDHSEAEIRQLSLEWLYKVRLPDPDRVASSYPHQISGGMQQRVLIAMALSASPCLLVLDEPTTNLDVTTQAVILALIKELIQDQEMAVLYVTHNLGVISQYCDRVGVMYASELVEQADTADLFTKPLHPYTQGLLDSVPQLGDTKGSILLRPIQGQIPAIGKGPTGCVFRTRCPIAIEICKERPPMYPTGSTRSARCHRWQEIAQGEVDAHQELPGMTKQGREISEDQTDTLQLENVSISFPVRRSIRDLLSQKTPKAIRAVNEVSLAIPPGTTLGLVGESGSGKTTLARSIMGLQQLSSGKITLHQVVLPDQIARRDLELLRQLQIIFQNPQEALNPHIPVGETLQRPFIRLLGLSTNAANARVNDLLESVQLSSAYAQRLPGDLSGGEIQRVALARAIASHPDLLVMDEPISSLDVSVQAAILNLVNELQSDHNNSLLFISHNLAVVGYLADQIAVIYVGFLMEVARQDALFTPPLHPYTEALISAIPHIDPAQVKNPIYLEGEIPDPANLPDGCPFHTRCPRFIGEICSTVRPPWQVDPATGKRIFCHIPLDQLSTSQADWVSASTKMD